MNMHLNEQPTIKQAPRIVRQMTRMRIEGLALDIMICSIGGLPCIRYPCEDTNR